MSKLIRLLPAKGTYATGTLTLTGVAVANETVTIGSTVYTWKAAPAAAYEVKVGASGAACVTNLVSAINATAADSGTLWGAGTLAHPSVTAVDGAGDTVVITANETYEGPAGVIATTETMTNASWGAVTTTGGGTSALNSAPTTATQGTAVPFNMERGTLFAKSILGSGVMTFTGKLWGYNTELAAWFPLGTNATAASKGLLNEANAIGETGTDAIAHCEALAGLRGIHRLYLEVTAIGGTATEVYCYVACVPADSTTA